MHSQVWLGVLLAVVSVQGIEYPGHGGYEQQDYHHEAPAHYSYNYQVHDSKTGDVKEAKEERQGDLTTGEYSLIEPDGTKRIVKYQVKGKSGFQAVVLREGHGHKEESYHGHGGSGYEAQAHYQAPQAHHYQAPQAHYQPAPAHYQAPQVNHYQAPQVHHYQAPQAHYQPAPQVSYHAPQAYEAPKSYYATKYSAPAPKYEAPKYYSAPKYEAPKYYSAPKYEAPKYEAPKYEAPKYSHGGATSYQNFQSHNTKVQTHLSHPQQAYKPAHY